MWFKIFLFELKYRSTRPATYIYFAILFLLSFLAVSTDVVQIGGGVGLVKENAPSVISEMMVILTFFLVFITSAIMGVPVIRDFEHRMEAIMFTNPIGKLDYLAGRFLGSFVVLVLVFTGMVWGFMLGDLMPWRDADKLLPFSFYRYWQPFFVLSLPSLFFSGALFFTIGALTRKTIAVYTQGIILFVGYQVALLLTRDLENRAVAALLDPFALITTRIYTQYWTVAEQNTLMVPLADAILYNRLLWVGIGVVSLVVLYARFSFNLVRGTFRRKKRAPQEKVLPNQTDIAIPVASVASGWRISLQQLGRQTLFYARSLLKELPFVAVVLCGILVLAISSVYLGRTFGAYTYPTTYLMLEQVQGFNIFFIIILILYSGELVWKERGVKMDQIFDALPVNNFVSLVSKFLGMLLVYVFLILVLILTGVIIQTFKGYYQYEIGLYFSRMFTEVFPFLVLYTLFAFFVHVMVNHKFVGHATVIVFFIAMIVLDELGLEHALFQFGEGDLGPYSDMNGYGHFPLGFSWFQLYWLAFAVGLFTLAVVLGVRGSEATVKTRWRTGRLRLTRPIITLATFSGLMFLLSGCYIYYNTNVVNKYQNSDDQKEQQAHYEKTLKHYRHLPQPKITTVALTVELYPRTRDYVAEGTFTLENKHDVPIDSIHLQWNPDPQITLDSVGFAGGATLARTYDDFRYHIYVLDRPLLPGEARQLSFKQLFTTQGFVESGSNTRVVGNGSFITSQQFPTLGYNEGYELSDDDDRADYDLAPKDRLLPRDDERELANGIFGDDGDQIDFALTVGTDSSQTAIAPGYLQEEWTEGDRRYFRYRMDKPIFNFYAVLSADYEVLRDRWVPAADSLGELVNLEIYYHPGHEYNLDRMMKSLKRSFDYYAQNFSPYQYRQMRILEFPRYESFAQSFSNTVPFSESIGFMLDIDDEEDVDIAYYVTAHEIAHQWWGHQVMAANVQGSQMIVEALSQYSALMVMKQEYPEEKLEQFLKEELERYLRGRTGERKREMPLALAENQTYIHYGKGAVNLFALQDYIGENRVNRALRRFVEDWNFIDGERIDERFPTTEDLLTEFRRVTPDSLNYLVEDLFEKIILYENKVNEATYAAAGDDQYRVDLTLQTKKMEADTLGVESPVPLRDYIEVGVYAETEAGEEELIYLEKHPFTEEESELSITVDQKPSKVGIDPIHKLIDRNPDDNTRRVTAAESA